MKKTTLSLIICFCAHQLLHSQSFKDSLPPNKMHANELSRQYFEKGKGLETAGFVLLGVGMAATIGGFYGTVNNYDLFTGHGSGYIVLWIVGVASLATGVPVLINGFHYKRKAHLILRHEDLSRNYHVPIKSSVLTVGIAFTIR
ncbi:MAG TPA: hypothetical protein VNV85_04095 [Puia sp.]|jgi:hypothetical protein|nr:hypothetical protein [Puia sp.]